MRLMLCAATLTLCTFSMARADVLIAFTGQTATGEPFAGTVDTGLPPSDLPIPDRFGEHIDTTPTAVLQFEGRSYQIGPEDPSSLYSIDASVDAVPHQYGIGKAYQGPHGGLFSLDLFTDPIAPGTDRVGAALVADLAGFRSGTLDFEPRTNDQLFLTGTITSARAVAAPEPGTLGAALMGLALLLARHYLRSCSYVLSRCINRKLPYRLRV